MKLKENGDNLSLDEKQLIYIAKIFLGINKIVANDEANSNIDNKTEILIQDAIDKIFKISTIEHKIHDLKRYDKIMVLDNGLLVEFDTPDNLLKNKNSVFNQLYENKK